ncbi:MAG: zinc ribbon domain-containing protein [Coriobacteriales bacterium]|nr:zinc ribbon domain-containing protein [Coriobacteriales bacterium]
MAYETMYVTHFGEEVDKYAYPSISSDGDIEREEMDGSFSRTDVANNIYVVAGDDTSQYIEKIHINIYVTDSRVVLSSTDYIKGGTWISTDLISGAIMTGIEKGIAAVRRKGKMFIGHIRYEWLQSVAYIRQSGMLSKDSINLVYKSDDIQYRVKLSFKEYTDTSALAQKIVKKCIAYRLNMSDPKDEAEIEFYNKNAHEPQWKAYSDANGKYFDMYSAYQPPLGGKKYHPLYGTNEIDGPNANASNELEGDNTNECPMALPQSDIATINSHSSQIAASIPDSSLSASADSNNLNDNSMPNTLVTNFCPQCGNSVTQDQRFCANCGASLVVVLDDTLDGDK